MAVTGGRNERGGVDEFELSAIRGWSDRSGSRRRAAVPGSQLRRAGTGNGSSVECASPAVGAADDGALSFEGAQDQRSDCFAADGGVEGVGAERAVWWGFGQDAFVRGARIRVPRRRDRAAEGACGYR